MLRSVPVWKPRGHCVNLLETSRYWRCQSCGIPIEEPLTSDMEVQSLEFTHLVLFVCLFLLLFVCLFPVVRFFDFLVLGASLFLPGGNVAVPANQEAGKVKLT